MVNSHFVDNDDHVVFDSFKFHKAKMIFLLGMPEPPPQIWKCESGTGDSNH